MLSVLERNAIFNVLNPEFVHRRRLRLGERCEPESQKGEPLGLAMTPFAAPGKVALYLEDEAAGDGTFGTVEGDTIALRIEAVSGNGPNGNGAGPHRFLYVPACAAPSPQLSAEVDGTDLMMFDGILATFSESPVARKVLIHINNTIPILPSDSAEGDFTYRSRKAGAAATQAVPGILPERLV